MGDPYNTITIYRNAGLRYPISVQTPAGYPQSITGYGFAFQIGQPVSGDNVSFGTVVYINSSPTVVEPGSILFQMSDSDTASLSPTSRYNYAVMFQPSGYAPVVQVIGIARVIDAPKMPAYIPLP